MKDSSLFFVKIQLKKHQWMRSNFFCLTTLMNLSKKKKKKKKKKKTRISRAKEINNTLNFFGIPSLGFDEKKLTFSIEAMLKGDHLEILRNRMSELMVILQCTNVDNECWRIFLRSIDLASEWENGNALSEV